MTTYYQEPRPARKIPTKEQIAHRYTRTKNQSKQQYVPQQLDAEGEYELEEDEAYYDTRLPTSSRRYQGYEISPEHVCRSGKGRQRNMQQYPVAHVREDGYTPLHGLVSLVFSLW